MTNIIMDLLSELFSNINAILLFQLMVASYFRMVAYYFHWGNVMLMYICLDKIVTV